MTRMKETAKKSSTINQRRDISDANKERVQRWMREKGISFLRELSGVDCVLKSIPKDQLFLGYLLYEAELATSQIPIDLGMRAENIRSLKCSLLRSLESHSSFC